MGIGKFSKQTIIAAGIIIVGLLLFISMFLFKPHVGSTKLTEKRWPVHVFTLPESGDHISQVHLYGKVEHSRLTQLTSAVTSHVQQVAVKEGQSVEQNQLLVQLDSKNLELTLGMHQADLDHVAAESSAEQVNITRLEKNLEHQKTLLDLAQESLDRFDSLNQQTYVSKEELNSKQREYQLRSMEYNSSLHDVDINRLRLTQLQAQQKKLEHQIEQDKLNLSYCHIVAPESGQVTQLPVAVGERVQPADLIVEVMPHQQREVRALLPLPRVLDVEQLLAQQQMPLSTAEVSGRSVVLQLVRLARHVSPGQAGQEAIFEATQGGEYLVLGRQLSLYLSLAPESDSYLIPESALYHGDQVYTVVNGRLHATAVDVVGWHYDGLRRDYIIQSQDLASGMAILSNQLPNVVEGMSVLVQSSG